MHNLGVFAHGLTKHLPEAQGLVSTGCDHAASIRGDGHVQDTLSVASELRSLYKAWVAPQAELVLAVAMAGQDLTLMAAPLQCTHLAACVDGVQQGACGGVVELDAAVSSTASRCQ
eukprot:GHUV01015778.1.p2 GENE.GHUV01015778.1~~GHUV01015778.1.p2  ORF type:complete len:116 (-),score=26.70 GHUV01015778.1:208-555(-)